MAEQAQALTPKSDPVRVIVEQPPQLSPEDRMWNAVNPPQPEKPRAPDGKFVSNKPQEAQAQQQPQQEQQPAEQAQPEGEQPAQQALPEGEAPSWEEVKDVVLKVPMKANGKEWVEELSLEQLRSERMMRNEFNRRNQEFAQKEQQYQAMTQQAIANERGQYMQALQALQQVVLQSAAPELQNVNWDQLATDDPAEYVRRSNRAKQINESLTNINAQMEQLQAQQQAYMQQNMARAVQESKQKIAEAIPDWNDDVYRQIMERGVKTYGFSPQEMSMAYDHRFIKLLHDANQFHAMKEQKPTIEKKVQAVPPVLKPGQKAPVNQGLQKLKEARERVKTSGNIDSVADMFKAMGF